MRKNNSIWVKSIGRIRVFDYVTPTGVVKRLRVQTVKKISRLAPYMLSLEKREETIRTNNISEKTRVVAFVYSFLFGLNTFSDS